uniref:Uncharacterized protein n=1 Tax=Arundo donax TaxID=35708 RepID=A0A0A9GK44_ARUDO
MLCSPLLVPPSEGAHLLLLPLLKNFAGIKLPSSTPRFWNLGHFQDAPSPSSPATSSTIGCPVVRSHSLDWPD